MITSKYFKSVQMKLHIWKGGIQFRFRNEKHNEIFNNFNKHFTCVSEEIDTKVTCYYSTSVRKH